MKLLSSPGSALCGSVTIPGDKSISHRAALLGAISDGECKIENFLVAGVTNTMLRALRELGVPWKLDTTTLIIQGQGLRGLKTPNKPIDCGNSATTMRLLAGLLSAAGIEAVLDGSSGLRRRPMHRILEPLRKMGVEIEASLDGTAPLILHARHPDKRLNAIDYSLPIASAQVKSCLLLAALAGNGITILREPGLSRDHTERLFRKLGIRISTERLGITNNIYLDPQLKIGIPPFSIRIPGDISSAAFLWVGGLITPGSEIVVEHVGLNPTRNGLYNALSSMGGELMITELHDNDYEPTGTTRIRHARLSGVNISGDIVVRMIDEFPAFGIAASFASGTSVIRDAIELRHKESDRIHAFCSELARVGGHAIETEDGFIVHGGHTLNGGSAESHNDHRLGMAFAVAGQASKEAIIIQNSEIINESFPGFVDVMKCLGARIQQINE